MKTYELALILTEQAGKDEVKAKKLVSDLISEVKGKVKKTNNILGIRDFAYPIKKLDRGWYGFFMVELPETSISSLDKNIKMKEEIIRYLLVRTE